MGLYKKSSGLIFDDRFDQGMIHSRYELSPTSVPFLDSSLKQLVLPHTESETMVIFDISEMEQSLAFEVLADYIPTEQGDEGGIVVWQDGYHLLEFLESYHSTSREYCKWRAITKGNKWTFYADRGSGWELIDGANLDARKLGIILKNPQRPGYDTLNVDRLILCRSTKISVGNLPEGYMVYLCNEKGDSISSAVVQPHWTGVELELPTLPYHGILKVYDQKGELLSTLGSLDIYGGDVYLYGTDLRVIWKGAELSLTQETYLGTMYDNTIEVQMELYNPSVNKVAQHISMGILKYLEKFGYEWADICHDNGMDQPVGDYAQRLEMGDLEPLGDKKFWMRVERKSELLSIEPIHFILDITHW